jgi:predicted nicotinamide N-methyase
LKYIDQFPLEGKKILELGAGSGLIAIHAAKKLRMLPLQMSILSP